MTCTGQLLTYPGNDNPAPPPTPPPTPAEVQETAPPSIERQGLPGAFPSPWPLVRSRYKCECYGHAFAIGEEVGVEGRPPRCGRLILTRQPGVPQMTSYIGSSFGSPSWHAHVECQGACACPSLTPVAARAHGGAKKRQKWTLAKKWLLSPPSHRTVSSINGVPNRGVVWESNLGCFPCPGVSVVSLRDGCAGEEFCNRLRSRLYVLPLLIQCFIDNKR